MSNLHRFFYGGPIELNSIVTLDADTAKHLWQVLRMKAGDTIELTDGKGTLAECMIHTSERHKCTVSVRKIFLDKRSGKLLHLAVAFTKNNSRNEWLLEKATELGVASIIPITTTRSEKAHVRIDRWEKILQSAILQSQQTYLPYLGNVTPLPQLLQEYADTPQKFVAHCIDDNSRKSFAEMLNPTGDTLLLIGPEGDFTADEVNLCMANGFIAVSLGKQRLRTETAAMAAAAYFNVMYNGKN